jgi:hypothetical protein
MPVRRHLRLLLALTFSAAAFGLASAQPVPDQAPQPTAPPSPPPPAVAAPPEEGPPPAEAAPPAPSVPTVPPESSAGGEGPSGSGEAAKAPPPRRTLYTAAVIQVLDKVTAESLTFEAPLHRFVRYKGLIFLVNTCQSGEPDKPEAPAAAHVEVDSQAPALPGHPPNPVKLVFRGWMFADTPGVHPLQHPVYDAWLIACKTASPGA